MGFALSLGADRTHRRLGHLGTSSHRLRQAGSNLHGSVVRLMTSNGGNDSRCGHLRTRLGSGSGTVSSGGTGIGVLHSSVGDARGACTRLTGRTHKLRGRLSGAIGSLRPRRCTHLRGRLRRAQRTVTHLHNKAGRASKSFLGLKGVGTVIIKFFTSTKTTTLSFFGSNVSGTGRFIERDIRITVRTSKILRTFRGLSHPSLLTGLHATAGKALSSLRLVGTAIGTGSFQVPISSVKGCLTFTRLGTRRANRDIRCVASSVIANLKHGSLLVLSGLKLSTTRVGRRITGANSFVGKISGVVSHRLARSKICMSTSSGTTRTSTELRGTGLGLKEQLS